nr:MAG: ORF1 [TTV-like mini virus]
MPTYYRRPRWRWRRRNFRRPFRYQRRRFRPRYRRPRTTVRRKRQRWVRKNLLFKKKKKKTLTLRQWQPELIRKSHIKGLFTLFACNEGRLNNNWPQYRDSYTPEFQPAGGGWGLFVFNLGALFQEFQRVRNYWTVSNINLPLVRYIYCTLKFYRADNVDYVATYTTSYPMTDNELRHADAQPSRMLMRKHKIIVQSRKHTHKKPYVKKRIYPPKQIINRWFFQRQFVNTNLLMLTVTACDLTHYDLGYYDISNNISLKSLNYYKFPTLNYQRQNTTTPFQPKTGTYLYGVDPNKISFNDTSNPLKNVKYGDLIFLGQATRRQPGISFTDSQKSTWNDYVNSNNSGEWGNPFHEEYIHDQLAILQSNVQPTNYETPEKQKTIESTKFTIMTEPMFETIRYNPDKDTGKDTMVYLVPNFQSYTEWKKPENDQLIFHGFPLWMLLWGWVDWQKKLALVNQIDQHYIIIIETKAFEPERPKYMLLDQEFLDNTLEFPQLTPDSPEQKPFLHDEQNWYPKFWYQQKSIEKICSIGPGTHKFKQRESIQAHLKYDFYFKWGGTPSTLETIADPSKQIQYPTPCDITSRIQIQDPTTDPRDLIYNFDIRRYELTQKATKRLTRSSDTEQSPSIFTDYFNPAPPQQEKDILQALIEAQTEKKEKEETLKLFQLLRERQQLVQQRLHRLIIQSIK